MYPFARIDRSVIIETHHGEEFLFEAPSKTDRDLFATRLKVLVARLASSVISHDEVMLREFFSSSTDSLAARSDSSSHTSGTNKRRERKGIQSFLLP